jgi:hypothetical protein
MSAHALAHHATPAGGLFSANAACLLIVSHELEVAVG